ncbi:cytochrome P450 family protein [Nonomuraea jabiensis]|uniref:Cytochrome P450 n=1 Tax=Nonomuraea jabiensis TaxID=882448 RepID=A0A7W9LF81_9ACTN|nr:cytochrome P450 [Nonomuraea jabiensis]MBB5781646.1 cytochrome P450 [Nonomuraea jabiensis]
MSIDGTWAFTAESPRGEQSFAATFTSDGERLAGTMTGAQGIWEIDEGSVHGNEVGWLVRRAVMGMNLRFTGVVDGDQWTGKVKVGVLGSFPASAVRTTLEQPPPARSEPSLISAEGRADPYPIYARIRQDGPVRPVQGPLGGQVWMVTGYEEARALLNDPRISKHPRHAPQWLRDLGIVTADEGPTGTNMLNSDPPDHTRLRRLVSKGFTPRRIEALRPRVQRITDDLLDRMAPLGRVDLIDAFAYPLPITVISELIGVPEEDRDDFRSWTAAMLLMPLEEELRARRSQGIEAINGYLAALIERKRRDLRPGVPRDEQPDLASALVAAADDEDGLNERELVGMLNLLLVAGHETTVNLIGNGMAALLRHPGQLALLRDQPQLLPSAIEEMLRHDGPVEQGTGRTAVENIEIGEVTIPAGSQVTVALAAADRDPRRFPDPDRFDIQREDNAHVAFGHGLHFCLGAPLARMEAQIAFRGLLDRFPDLALDCPPEQLRQRPGTTPLFRGLAELPVKFTPAAR